MIPAAPGRIGWLDAVRGAGTLAALTVAARWLLHPRAHLLDPDVPEGHTPASRAWWLATETLADETGVWLLAAAMGAALAAGREQDPGPGWRRTHCARAAALAVLGAAVAVGLWPGGILLPFGLVALLLTRAAEDRESPPWGVAALAAGIGLAGGLPWNDGQGLLLLGSRLPHEPVTFGSADYNAWETAGYAGSWAAATAVRLSQLLDQLETIYPFRLIWQAGAGMLAGIWWQREGRHARLHPAAPPLLAAAGLVLTGGAAWAGAASGHDPWAVSLWQAATYAGGALLAAAAVAAATHAPRRLWARGPGGWAAACGRRSLTAALTATLGLAAFAQGWGFGLHGRLGAEETVAATMLAIGIGAAAANLCDHRAGRGGGAEGALRLAVRLLAGRRRPRRRGPP